MANEEHMTIIRQGVAAWNQWREENREILPDLSGPRLMGANLNGVDFFLANLSDTNL